MRVSDLVGMGELEANHAVCDVEEHWDYVCFYTLPRKVVWPDPDAIHLSVRLDDNNIVIEAFLSSGTNEKILGKDC